MSRIIRYDWGVEVVEDKVVRKIPYNVKPRYKNSSLYKRFKSRLSFIFLSLSRQLR